jgi:hypothetical protein
MPDSASAAGALITHGGSFTGNNYDDLVVEQNGYLAVATNPGTSGTWAFATTNVTKPSCASCANYNGQDWSSTVAMTALPTGAAARPDLLTVEVVNGVATLWHYPASTTGYTYGTPTQVSTTTSTWAWTNVQIVGVGVLPGHTGDALWVRRLSDGQLFLLYNLEAGISDPATAAVSVGSPLSISTYPLLTTFGRADTSGNLALWATDNTAGGKLDLIPTNTTTSGVTTVGSPTGISNSNWSTHNVALGSSYVPYNNFGIAADGATNNGRSFDTATANWYSYSSTALTNASLDPSVIVNDGAGGCPVGWTTCSTGIGPANTLYLPNSIGGYDPFVFPGQWTQGPDNYTAANQVLPVPVPNTSGPAHVIRFLGAAATSNATNGASVNATITYTNGDTQTITITFPDWTKTPVANDTVVASTTYRLTGTGATDNTATYLYATPDFTLTDNGNPLASTVQIASITLATNSAVHVFSVGVS